LRLMRQHTSAIKLDGAYIRPRRPRMRDSYLELYLHLVWSTWDRRALITPEIREPLYACIQAQVKKLGCEPIAIGGMEDHMHLLVRWPTTVTIADVVKHAKGGSSHHITHVAKPGSFFKWQHHYGALTVGSSRIDGLRHYILHQPEHHLRGTIHAQFERCDEPFPVARKS
jgi:putative transposase